LEPPPGNEASIGDLFGRLADEGRDYARAEIGLWKAVARRRIGLAKGGLIALVLAAMLINAGLIALLIFLGLWIAIHLGPVIAGLILFAAAAILAFGLVRFGLSRIALLAGDPEEKAALAEGERP
jgi:hypothetical protein